MFEEREARRVLWLWALPLTSISAIYHLLVTLTALQLQTNPSSSTPCLSRVDAVPRRTLVGRCDDLSAHPAPAMSDTAAAHVATASATTPAAVIAWPRYMSSGHKFINQLI